MATLYGDDEHPVIEALIDGTWTDVSARTRGEQRVTITRGRANEQTRTSPQRANLSFDNRDAFFSTRAPGSVNYRKIGKNTQMRVRAGSDGNHLKLPYNDLPAAARVETADKASLDITGDIDIRADIHPHSWRPSQNMVIASKYLTVGDQRSWILRLSAEGKLIFGWSSAGTFATFTQATSTVGVSIPSTGRLAVRVTLDVNNGAGGKTATFYTSDSVTGTWTTLGTAVTTAGTTSVYASTALLIIGAAEATQGAFTSTTGYGGKVYRVQVRNGIAGTVVADFDPESRSLGDTSWSDGLASANTWTLVGVGVRVTSDRVRFWGELASLPKQWDKSTTDSTVPAQASGMLRRLSQGAKPLDSAMTRNFKGVSSFAWWPLEDESTAVRAANLAQGTSPLAVIYTAQLVDAVCGASDSPPGAKSSLAFNSNASRFGGSCFLREQQAPATYSIVFYLKIPSLPASGSKVFFSMKMSGQVAKVECALSSSSWDIVFYDIIDQVITSSSTGISLISPAGRWVGYNLLLQDDGSDMTYSQRWDTIGAFGGGVGPTTIAGQNVAPPTRLTFTAQNDTVFEQMNLSHVFVTDIDFDLSNDTYRDASNAYLGETAADRLARLSTEEGVPMEITGLAANSETMGYQTIATYPDLIAECWEVDGGIGGEARDALALEYRTRADLESRQDVVLSHALHHLSEVPQPVDDDQAFANDVTVTRVGGSAARALVTEGFTSISEPPDGVGRYNTDVTLNAASDARLVSIAGWAALVGSWDQDRYPGISIGLHRSVILADDDLYAAVVKMNLGDTVTLAGLPSWMPPDDVPQIAQGYTEQLSRFLWQLDLNCTPAGPYQAVPVLGSDVFVPRLDGTTHSIGADIDDNDTSISIVTQAGSAVWVDSAGYAAEFPLDIEIGGEVMTLTAVSGTSSPQTGTVTRSVNGIVKAHTAGALVRLARPFYIGR